MKNDIAIVKWNYPTHRKGKIMSDYFYRRRINRRCQDCQQSLPVWTERDNEESTARSRVYGPFGSTRYQLEHPKVPWWAKNRSVIWMYDPYDFEVHHQINMMWLCRKCYVVRNDEV